MKNISEIETRPGILRLRRANFASVLINHFHAAGLLTAAANYNFAAGKIFATGETETPFTRILNSFLNAATPATPATPADYITENNLLREHIETYLTENHAFLLTHIGETLHNTDIETFITVNPAGELTLFDILLNFNATRPE